ncbi:MAG: YdeI/OmpD-associated family protein [Pirellulaceae bacterium]|nr:YdeI/OmpD-associated family protein [Pirellulaceae bacterium]
MNPKVDEYLIDGCGRCPLFRTPECKVNFWREEMKRLRSIVLQCGLTEEVKWGIPCYTLENQNVLTISALKNYCAIGFFKGVLLQDAQGILSRPGENSQSSRLIRFTNVREIDDLELTLREYIREAIEVEKKGLKVDFKAKSELVLPDELIKKFEELPALQTAFTALTPGRQRGYVLYFAAAKQSKTRASRIEKCIPDILEGRGLHD